MSKQRILLKLQKKKKKNTHEVTNFGSWNLEIKVERVFEN